MKRIEILSGAARITGMRLRRAAAGVALFLFLVSARLGRADYVPNPRIVGNASDHWLFDAASDAVKAGAKTVTEKLLTSVARGLLNSLSTGLGDFIFGRNRDLDRAVEVIVEEIRASHADLAQRHRDLLEEVTVQFAVDLIGDLNAASNILASWLASQDPLARQTSVDVLLRPMADLERVRNVIEAYIQGGASPEILAKRLQLLPLHATAAQLGVIASRYYWATAALTTAFRRVHGADDSKFDTWVGALSAEDLACMEDSTPQFRTFRDTVYDGAVEFYRWLAERDPVRTYVDRMFTPLVTQSAVFLPDSRQYDKPEVVTARASWGVRCGKHEEPCPGVFLDGLRGYYYVGIPSSDCVSGFAYHHLEGGSPWQEIPGDPAGSLCNRFWVLDPYVNPNAFPPTTGPPSAYFASFVRYAMQWRDLEQMYELHKTMVHGDVLRAIYGPTAQILDGMYTAVHGGVRPRNQWDDAFAVYDRMIAILAVGEGYSYAASPIFEDVIVATERLAAMGITIESIGLEAWAHRLEEYVASGGGGASVASSSESIVRLQVLSSEHPSLPVDRDQVRPVTAACPWGPADSGDRLASPDDVLSITVPRNSRKPLRLAMVSRDTTLTLGDGPATADDPTKYGGSLRITTVGPGSVDLTLPLPARGWHWSKRTQRYTFGGAKRKPSLVVKSGKALVVHASIERPAGVTDVRPDVVSIVVTIGRHSYCLRFTEDPAATRRTRHIYAADQQVAACPAR